MAKKDHVEVQKGPIKCQVPTWHTMSHKERVAEAQQENRMRRDYQSLHLHEPKK